MFTASHATARHILGSAEFGAASTMVSPRRVSEDDPVHPLDEAFLTKDPPQHGASRGLVAPWFGRAAVEALVPHIEETVSARLDALPLHTPVDLVGALIEPIPTSTICRILGLPTADIPRIVRWGRLLAELIDGPRTPRQAQCTHDVLTEMTQYLAGQLNWPSRTVPGELTGRPLLDGLARHCLVNLTVRETVATAGMLLVGGHATTASLIGNAVDALLQHPQYVPTTREQADTVAEETLRWDPPVQYVVRVARHDCVIEDNAVARGTPVVVLLAGASRDPLVFDRPAQFDPARPGARRHIAFGAGIHYCLGAGLARLEAGIALHQLYQRYTVRPAGPSVRIPSRGLRGMARLPVLLAPRLR